MMLSTVIQESVRSIAAALERCLESSSTSKNYNRQLECYSKGAIEKATVDYFDRLSQ